MGWGKVRKKLKRAVQVAVAPVTLGVAPLNKKVQRDAAKSLAIGAAAGAAVLGQKQAAATLAKKAGLQLGNLGAPKIQAPALNAPDNLSTWQDKNSMDNGGATQKSPADPGKGLGLLAIAVVALKVLL